MRHSTNRRHFLLSAGSATASLAFPRLGHAAKPEAVRIGVIGCSGRAVPNWNGVAAAGGRIEAVCDVDEPRAAAIRKAHPKAKFFKDFRRLIEAGGLDAIVVSTADHAHFHASYLAAKAGLHIYCEKPLCHSVGEVRRLSDIAAEKKLVTQMGTQIHAENNYRRVVEILQAGAIGDVSEVKTWVGTNYGPKSLKAKVPAPSDKLPAGFDYDLWLGPVAERPYSSAYHPQNWRHFWAFGGGALTDMACHHMDLPFWALKLRHPTTVAATGAPLAPEICPDWCEVEYEFPRDGKPPLKLTWSDGERSPALLKELGLERWKGGGNLFVGSRGMLIADYGRYQLLPADNFKDFKAPPQSIPNSTGHYKEWMDAIRHGGTTTCNFDYSGALAEAVLLGAVAFRTGKKLDWDAGTLTAKGVPEAAALIRPEYRKGWEI